MSLLRVADSVIFLSYLVSHQSPILTENVIFRVMFLSYFCVRSKGTFDGQILHMGLIDPNIPSLGRLDRTARYPTKGYRNHSF